MRFMLLTLDPKVNTDLTTMPDNIKTEIQYKYLCNKPNMMKNENENVGCVMLFMLSTGTDCGATFFLY